MADTPAVASLRGLIRKFLDESELKYLRDGDEDFVLPFRNIMVHVTPHQWGDDQTVVAVVAVTNENMRIDKELTEFIAVENGRILFGKLCLYLDRKQVRFEHPLLGDFLNRDELGTAVKIVGSSAVGYESQIKEKWGGI